MEISNEFQQALKAIIEDCLDEKLAPIHEKLKISSLNNKSREVWSVQDIANYLNFTPAHVSRAIIKAWDFPTPLQLETYEPPSTKGIDRADSRRKLRYFAGDIIHYLETNIGRYNRKKRKYLND